jgi:hypothetical protein
LSKTNAFFKPTPKQEEFIKLAFSGKMDFILFGGAIRGGKTYALLGFFIICCILFKGSRYVVIRETLEMIKNTVLPTFFKIMPMSITTQLPNQSNGWEWKTKHGSTIKFFGVDIGKDPNLDRLRGLEADSFGIEEMDVSEAVFDKVFERVGTWNMNKRLINKQQGLPNPPALVLGSCNPRKDWVKNRIFDKWREGKLQPNWMYMPSRVYDNPHVGEDWLEDKRKNMSPKNFLMFVEGDWDVDLNDDPFFYNYDDSLHFAHDNVFDFDPIYPVYLSFDFNYKPTTCSVYQDVDMAILGMRCYEIEGGTEKLCELILEQNDLLKVPKYMWTITGDSSGMAKSSTAGDRNDYQIIIEKLGVSVKQLRGVHNRNKAHIYSRKVCDYFFNHVPFAMDKRMKKLRDDIVKAKPDSQGKLYKNREKGYAMDHLDNFRYFVNCMFPGGNDDIDKYVSFIKSKRG